MGKTYATPKKSVAGKKTAAPTTIKGTKPVVKTGKKVVLSASKTTSTKSKITKYAWDLNGDGTVDTESSTPDVEHVYDTPFDGTISVTATDENGASSTGYQDMQATSDDSAVTHEEPLVLPPPIITSERVDDDVVLSWQPVAGDMYITGAEGQLITVVSAAQGTVRITDAPSTTFELFVQHIDGVDASEPVTVLVAEKPVVVPVETVQPGAGSALPETQEQSSPIVSSLDLQQAIQPTQQAQVLGVQSVSANNTRIDTVVGATVEELPHIGGQPIVQLVWGVASLLGEFGIRIPITLLISALFASPQALLFLLALLLILLLIVLRDKKERVYRHEQRYRAPRHAVRSTLYRV
jgi:PKD repeat protein